MTARTGYHLRRQHPPDTKAIINGKKHKINFAYNSGGSDLLADTISEQLGIPVDFTVAVDLSRGLRPGGRHRRCGF